MRGVERDGRVGWVGSKELGGEFGDGCSGDLVLGSDGKLSEDLGSESGGGGVDCVGEGALGGVGFGLDSGIEELGEDGTEVGFHGGRVELGDKVALGDGLEDFAVAWQSEVGRAYAGDGAEGDGEGEVVDEVVAADLDAGNVEGAEEADEGDTGDAEGGEGFVVVVDGVEAGRWADVD